MKLQSILKQLYEEKQQLNEKQILYNQGADYGQVVFLAGGAGSGKGYALDNFMERKKFRVIDVDKYKSMYLDYAKIYKTDAEKAKQIGITDPLDMDAVKSYIQQNKVSLRDTYPELSDLDLQNPEDVSALHMFVRDKGIKPKVIQNLLSNKSKDRLPNILFDITAKDMNDITDIIPRLLDVGYQRDSIHVTWVLANYEIAVNRNRNRDRIVPDDILLKTHEGAAQTMIDIIKNGTPPGVDGAVRVILNNPEHTVTYDREATGTGEEVIKDFKYLTIKEEGKPYKAEKDVQREMFFWIKNNIPKTVDLWQRMNV